MSARADNADLRLTKLGRTAGVVGDRRWSHFEDEVAQIEELKGLLLAKKCSSPNWVKRGFRVHLDSIKRSALDLLRLKDVTVESLIEHIPEITKFPLKIRNRVGIEG